MKPALLLVDLQHDFLQRSGLAPCASAVVENVSTLLQAWRKRQLPVLHAHTLVKRDGANRMPHWKRQNTWACVEGTPGAMPPEALRPTPDESTFTKQFYSAFADASLDAALRRMSVDTLVIAGVYTHGCVRATAFDAYERGYEVWIADDAVSSTEPGHAEITRMYLADRAATFIDTPALLACVDGKDIPPNASSADNVSRMCSGAARAQRTWRDVPPQRRADLLNAWANDLDRRADALAKMMAVEIGKPITTGRAEVVWAGALIRASARRVAASATQAIDADAQVYESARPHGVAGLITPWNNPVGVPVGKIAPALAFGNGVVWKPAMHAPRTTSAVWESLRDAGIDGALVGIVQGEAAVARSLIDHPDVGVVSLTGSIATGRAVAARCVFWGKPLQTELGGNNAAIVMEDFDIAASARDLALSAMSFCGQRCTAIQRFIVQRTVVDRFVRELVAAVKALRLGDPLHAETELGPLVSLTHRASVQKVINCAVADGARLLCGGTVPEGFDDRAWLTPSLLTDVAPEAPICRDEIFGPVAVILPAADVDQAIAITNRVEHGLVAALHTENASYRQRFAGAVEAGILKFTAGPLSVHTEAPFAGWKSSGFGPPEHGRWDQQFYTRPQALYGWDQREQER